MFKVLPKSIKNPQGFTLVELLVVVSIIAILSVIGLAVFSGVQKNARDARRKADIDAMAKALEASYSNGTYQTSLYETMFASGKVPVDPQGAGSYIYSSTLTSTGYTLCAKLESGSGGNYSDGSCGTAAANGGYYGVKNQQ